MTRRVFVYGTLKRGYGNHRLLREAKFLGTAVTMLPKFRMTCVGFPKAYDTGADHVAGEVYEVDDATLARLDCLECEGSLYDRKTIKVIFDHGPATECDMYIACYGWWHDERMIEPDADGVLTWNGRK